MSCRLRNVDLDFIVDFYLLVYENLIILENQGTANHQPVGSVGRAPDYVPWEVVGSNPGLIWPILLSKVTGST